VGLSAGGDSPNPIVLVLFFNPFIEVSDRLTPPFHLHYKYECYIRTWGLEPSWEGGEFF
jgi:hypothetical protein